MLPEAEQLSCVRDVGGARALVPGTMAQGHQSRILKSLVPTDMNIILSTHHSSVASHITMSSISSTSTLASWDPTDLFQLVNPDKMSITCVGYAPSCRRRCRNPIAYHNVQAAKAVIGQIVRPGVNNTDLKEMLFNLAEYTLCRRYHQDQATDVSNRWFGMVQRHRDDEDDRGSDTSDDDEDGDSDDGASSTTSSSDDNDDAAPNRANNDAKELRRRFDELETLQREFEELLQRLRRSFPNRRPQSTIKSQTRQSQACPQQSNELSCLSTTQRRALRNAEQARQEANHLTEQRAREAAREQRRLDQVEQTKREETQRQAQREKEAKAEADHLTAQRAREAVREQHRLDRAEQAKREETQRQAQREKEAKAETKRLREEQAEKARLVREREKQKKEQQSRVLSWETAWLRYETAWAEITDNNAHVDTDIRTSQIWPTKSGSFLSCSEEDVGAFFRCQPEDGGRRVLRRQALRWHPDRAARLFAGVADELVMRELLKTVTMISQVVIGIMGVASQ